MKNENAEIVVELGFPFKVGKEGELIEKLVMRPTARAFREFSLPMKDDGTVLFQPYECAKVGLKMAGHPATVVDFMHPSDMREVAQQVMLFFGVSQQTGSMP